MASALSSSSELRYAVKNVYKQVRLRVPTPKKRVQIADIFFRLCSFCGERESILMVVLIRRDLDYMQHL